MRVAMVNTMDVGGGAERIALELHRALNRTDADSHLLVGRQRATHGEPRISTIDHLPFRSPWTRWCASLAERRTPGASRHYGPWLVRNWRHWLGQPARILRLLAGREDVDFPASHHLHRLIDPPADIVHLHNMHGQYFDLHALTTLPRHLPVVITLHDTWTFAGHCGYFIDCPRYRIGCGACPDLSRYPPLPRDGTRANHQRKARIFRHASVTLVTPCRWLMDLAQQSILAPAINRAVVMPYGIDLDRFQPGDPIKARATLGLPRNARIVLFAAWGARANPYKDFDTCRRAVQLAAANHPAQGDTAAADHQPLIFIALGEAADSRTSIGRAELRCVRYETDAARMAMYYQAVDLYLHAAKADTFPVTILEALACATPVIATAVGGIPEQFDSLDVDLPSPPQRITWPSTGPDKAAGILTPRGDAAAMAHAINILLADNPRRAQLASNARRLALQRYDLRRFASQSLALYRECIAQHSRAKTHAPAR